jgi:hypothetical protein
MGRNSHSARGNLLASGHTTRNDVAKRTIKYLAVCKNPSLVHQVLKHAPPEVIKGVCNVALNAVENRGVHFTPQLFFFFDKESREIYTLSTRGTSLDKKRRVLHQKGSGFFIPALIGGVLSLLGSSIVSKIGGSS